MSWFSRIWLEYSGKSQKMSIFEVTQMIFTIEDGRALSRSEIWTLCLLVQLVYWNFSPGKSGGFLPRLYGSWFFSYQHNSK